MTNLDTLVTNINPPKDDAVVASWLAKHASAERPYLLAHADDGVIWGLWVAGQLHTSNKLAPAISPLLRGITLQQAFVFGAGDEIRLFRNELGLWQARRVVDAPAPDTLVETQVLWGNKVLAQFDLSAQQDGSVGFTHLQDRVQRGLDQVLPIIIHETNLPRDGSTQPRLTVHHFIEYHPQTGEARIGLSRLVNLGLWPDREEE